MRSYNPVRGNNEDRTSYGTMNQWRQFIRPREPCSHDYGRITPELDIPPPEEWHVDKDLEDIKKKRKQMVTKGLMQAKQHSYGSHIENENEKEAGVVALEPRLSETPPSVRKSPGATLGNIGNTPAIKATERYSYNNIHEICTPKRPRLLTQREAVMQTDPYDEMLLPHKKSDNPVHLQYYQTGGYDDYHKSFLKLQKDGLPATYPSYGPPRLRNGRVGGSWRHIKEVLQAGGKRTVFIDGGQRTLDNSRLTRGSVPGGNAIQPTWAKGHPLSPQNTNRFSKKPPNLTAYELQAYKGTEAANWHVMR